MRTSCLSVQLNVTKSNNHREEERDTKTDRQTERKRDRDRERERERGTFSVYIFKKRRFEWSTY